MQYLVFFAEITFLIQGFLFPFVFVYCCIYIYNNLLTPTTKKKSSVSSPDVVTKKKLHDPVSEVLKPLNCTSCGGVLLMDSQTKSCNHCGAATTIPPNYTRIFILREEATARLNKAGAYLLKARRLTSPIFRYLLLFLTIWVFASLFILLIGGAEKMTSLSDNLILYAGDWGNTFFGMSCLSWLMWVIILFFSYAIFSPKTQNKLPVLVSDTNLISKEEDADCSQCGANLHFKPKDLGCFCNYCGTETYRVKFTSAVFHAANDIRKKANFSLIEAMESYQEAVDDIISTPSMLILIFIILPFLMIVLPMVLLDFIGNHWLISIGIIFLLVIIIIVVAQKSSTKTKE